VITSSSFYNSEIPHVEDLSISKGFPTGAFAAMLRRAFQGENQSTLPLGRWKVTSSEEALNASTVYDHCVVTPSDTTTKTSSNVFYNTKLPDGDVPDLSQAGIPLTSFILPFLSKITSKSESPMEKVDLGRWQVRTCDEVLGANAAVTYDNCISTDSTQRKKHVYYHSKLPDGDVSDVSLTGLPINTLVVPFLRAMTSAKHRVRENAGLPLGRWKVKDCDSVRSSTVPYDHSVV
jgi:hypothetical protein